MRVCNAVLPLTLFCCSLTGVVSAQQEADDAAVSRGSAKGAVQFLFPEQISIEAGKSATADLHFKVLPGMHINSHTPYEKSLIPTNLAVVEGQGVKITAVDFPAGKDFSFSFSPNEKVSIYSDEFVLHAHLTAARGEHLLQAALRYQACDSNTCYPPKTIPVAIDIIAK